MKNILYIIAITAGLVSCEKDALEIQRYARWYYRK